MIFFNNKDHGFAIAAASGCVFNPDANPVVSRTNVAGKLLGGVIYQDYNVASISGHFASFEPGWLCPDLLWAIFHYPFVQLGCNKFLGYMPEYNHPALAFAKKLGFKYVTRVPGVFVQGDLVVLAMDRDECRWLQIRPRHLKDTDPDGKREQRPEAPLVLFAEERG